MVDVPQRTGNYGPKVRAGVGAGGPFLDLHINAAGVDVWPDGNRIVLRTGARTNAAGAYNGGGVGNKAILGLVGFDGPLSSLVSLEYTWTSELGPGGSNFNPPTGGNVVVPYANFFVDFGGGDLRVLVVTDSSEAPAISNAIGTYTNPGGLNVITHSWTAAQDVLIVNSPPNPVPGGVSPHISVGPTWPANSYRFSQLVAANPAARLVSVFPGNPVFFPTGDGGMPAGASAASIQIVSGDSGNVTKSGKTLHSIKVNGTELLAVP